MLCRQVPAAKQAKKAKKAQKAQESAQPGGEASEALLSAVAASPQRRPNALPTAVPDGGAADPEQGGVVLQVTGTYLDAGPPGPADSSAESYGTFEAMAADDDENHPAPFLCAPDRFPGRWGLSLADRLRFCCFRKWIVEQLRRPIEWVCEHTIPHEPEPGESTTVWLGCFRIGWADNWYAVGFVVSLAYVSLLAELILDSAKFACDAIGMSDDLEGVTVLAWGAQVPDCLASVAMAKKGLGPGAVANAVGSQIINVFIGLGLPYAIAGASLLNIHGGERPTESHRTATNC